ncbi:MAG: DUF2868 domain-containing protein [Comamonas sp.]|jgi:hypothetical protein|uniref:DUF2868 domain-containing protein n=1 Tax=Comamonas sp. TaxID=34028 RepID=UPI00282161DA|nr:DUF2868 domain-containing protein [Comamonas sp.]MDR0216552.1 DUF2868 domain-containing protein [Comamonas sp.]
MKASSARDIVFAHAMETAAPHESLPTAERCSAITAHSLHALGGDKAGSRTAYLRFLQDRARRIIEAAQLPADIKALRQQSFGVSRWLSLAVLAGALALGFAGHAITDPHRVDLLSPSLIGIVLWNVLVYGWLLVSGIRGLVRRRPSVVQALAPTQSATTSDATHWWQKLLARKNGVARGTGLRKMALNFEQNWWQLHKRSRHAQWLMLMHLGASMLALGALTSLWLTGLTNAYQVGWESTFLSPAAVQAWLNTLFAPVHALVGLAPWSLEQIQALQGWTLGGTPEMEPGLRHILEWPTPGQRWVQLYTVLLFIMVIAPRWVLALYQGVKLWWFNRHVELPLQQPYFQQLQRDWAGRATELKVQPYSLDMTPEREAALRCYVALHYGAGAQLSLQPVLAYGSPLPEADKGSAQQVLLLNLAATPEVEIHGALLKQVFAYWGAQTNVWLWAEDFRARNSGAPSRVQEREHLWREFVRNAGLNASLVPDAGV